MRKIFFDDQTVKIKILNTLYIIFLVSSVYRLILVLLETHGYDSWNISEFLINYWGGFVRRGLLGEGLFILTKNFDFDLEWAIKIACLVLYGLVSLFFIKSFREKGYTLYILPLGFFVGAFLNNFDWIRKDNLMILFLIFILLLYNKERWNFSIKIVLINILAILIILIHETFAFFALPILFVLLFQHFRGKSFRASFLHASLSLSPCIIALAFVFWESGTSETAHLIWDSWKPLLPSIEKTSIGHSVNSIGWDAVRTIKYHLRMNFLTHVAGIWSLLGWGLLFPVIYYISTNALAVFRKSPEIYTEKHRTVLSSLLLFQFVCLLPLFTFLSMDYFRILFYWTTSSFAVFLIFPIQRLEVLFPAFVYKWASHVNRFSDWVLPPSKTIMVIFMLCIGIPIGPFQLGWILNNSMLYSIMSILTEPIVILENLGFIDVYS